MADDKQDKLPETPPTRGQWSRRDVLRGGATVAVAGLSAAAAVKLYDPKGDAGLQPPPPISLKNYFEKVDFPAASPRISAAFGNHEQQIDQMVRAALGGLDEKGMSRFISKGDVVMIKPNVGFDRGPMLGATTNPEVVRAVIRLCREAGAGKIIVADNPIENPQACFAKSGIQAAAEAEGAQVMIHANAHDSAVQIRTTEPDPAKGEALGRWPIFWKPLEAADKVIGIPPIKDHNLCHASMSMKNWYGLLGGRRNQFHQDIHGIIADLALMMRPTFVVLDGTRVLFQSGPTGGSLADVKMAHTVVAARDTLAADAFGWAELLERRGEALPAYFANAAAKGLGNPDYRSLTIKEVQVG